MLTSLSISSLNSFYFLAKISSYFFNSSAILIVLLFTQKAACGVDLSKFEIKMMSSTYKFKMATK